MLHVVVAVGAVTLVLRRWRAYAAAPVIDGSAPRH
jgi:hypothetical protein